jgi:hypothetical protein
LGEQPSERDLGGRSILAGRDPAKQIDERLVGLHGFGRETREPASYVGERGTLVPTPDTRSMGPFFGFSTVGGLDSCVHDMF